LGLASCDSVITAPDVPQFYSQADEDACDERTHPEECKLRQLNYNQMVRVTQTWMNNWSDNGCGYLSGWFTSGWGERTFLWDDEIVLPQGRLLGGQVLNFL
jgi:hypothetical protein